MNFTFPGVHFIEYFAKKQQEIADKIFDSNFA